VETKCQVTAGPLRVLAARCDRQGVGQGMELVYAAFTPVPIVITGGFEDNVLYVLRGGGQGEEGA
jgi:hypothetical protein